MFGLFAKKCAYCSAKIARGKEVITDVKVIGHVGTHPTPFCSEKHSEAYSHEVEDHIKNQKPQGGCCG